MGREVQHFSEIKDLIERATGETKARLDSIESRQDQLEAAAQDIRPMGGGNKSATAIAEKKQFDTFCKTGQGLNRKDVSSSTASGAMIPRTIADEIVAKALGRSRIGDLVRNTMVESGDYSRILRVGGATSGWSSETGTRSATTEPSYRAITPTSGELYAYYTVSNWALQDAWFDLARELTDAITAQFGKDLEAAIISGNGSSRPTGMLASNPTSTDDNGSPLRAAGVYEYVPSLQAGGLGHSPASSPQRFGDDRLLDLFFTLKPEYRAAATWLMASPTLAAVRKFKDVNGQPIWQPSMAANVDQGGDGFLFGKPVVVCESMPAIGSNAFPIGVGDLNQGYELVRIHGLDITRDDVTTPGKTKFFVRCRMGGAPLDNDAIKFLKCATNETEVGDTVRSFP